MIRNREVSSQEIVEAHIRRIQEVNPRINAVVQDRFEEARAEASEADRKAALAADRNALPPFLGVPCTIKESFALTGMPQTSGLVARRGVVAEKDATAVSRIRAAGAIPMGVTNVSELCMWMESCNKIYGRTKNPYDPSRIAGGSSGGEGAVIGAGGSPFGLGSDIGGSIRMPAFFNGVFGHKPTGGLVPGTGQYPFAEGQARRFVTTGPMARRAEDLWPLLRILQGPDGLDDGCTTFASGDPGKVDLSEVEVIDVPDNGVNRVSSELMKAQSKVVSWLGRRCARVVKLRIPELRESLYIWSSMVSAASDQSYSELLGNGRPINRLLEAVRSLWGGSPYTIPSIGLALLEEIPKLLPSATRRYVESGHRLRQKLVRLIGPSGVMIFPSYVSVAPHHVMPLIPPFNWTYTAILNVMELPSTQVPLGLNHQGLPLGVQVIGIHGNDHLTIAVAMELEKAMGGWVPQTL